MWILYSIGPSFLHHLGQIKPQIPLNTAASNSNHVSGGGGVDSLPLGDIFLMWMLVVMSYFTCMMFIASVSELVSGSNGKSIQTAGSLFEYNQDITSCQNEVKLSHNTSLTEVLFIEDSFAYLPPCPRKQILSLN